MIVSGGKSLPRLAVPPPAAPRAAADGRPREQRAAGHGREFARPSVTPSPAPVPPGLPFSESLRVSPSLPGSLRVLSRPARPRQIRPDPPRDVLGA